MVVSTLELNTFDQETGLTLLVVIVLRNQEEDLLDTLESLSTWTRKVLICALTGESDAPSGPRF